MHWNGHQKSYLSQTSCILSHTVMSSFLSIQHKLWRFLSLISSDVNFWFRSWTLKEEWHPVLDLSRHDNPKKRKKNYIYNFVEVNETDYRIAMLGTWFSESTWTNWEYSVFNLRCQYKVSNSMCHCQGCIIYTV